MELLREEAKEKCRRGMKRRSPQKGGQDQSIASDGYENQWNIQPTIYNDDGIGIKITTLRFISAIVAVVYHFEIFFFGNFATCGRRV